MKSKLTGLICAALITAYTGYVLLDTFVLEQVYEVDAITQEDLVGSESADSDNEDSTADESADAESENEDADDNSSASDNGNGSDSSTDNGSGFGSGSSSGGHGPGSSGGSSSNGHGPGSHGGHSKPGSHSSSSGSGSNSGSGSGSNGSGSSGTNSSSSNSTSSSSSVTGGTVIGTATTDDGAEITVTEYRVNDTTVYVADVEIDSATDIKTAFAKNSYGKNVTETTSAIASDNAAVLAINGDYYGAQETGYVIRNGKLYRSTSASDTEVFVIYKDGSVAVKNTSDVTAEELLADGAWQVLSFGPALVENGSVAVSAGEEVGKAMASNPRTAIGVIDEYHYVFVVSDGRTSESEGLSLSELAEFMQSLGVETAYNLDGGGSSTMYFNGEVINNPTTSGNSIKERSVSDIVYIS